MTKHVKLPVVLLATLAFWIMAPELVAAENVCNPCAAKSAKAGSVKNSVNKGFKTFADAAAKGSKLWDDARLGTTGFTCLSGGCHADFENMNFEKNRNFPHLVEMADRVVTLTQIINYCLENPMGGKALKADSDEMTAMAAFYRAYRMRYRNR